MLLPFASGTLIGITILHFFTAWPPGWLMRIIILSLAIILFVYSCVLRQCLYRSYACFFFSICLGWGWAYYQVSLRMDALSTVSFSPVMVCAGKITGITHTENSRLQFDMALDGKRGWKVRFYWNNPTLVLQDGDKISVKAKIKRPWSKANPGGMDQERFYFLQNIAALGQVFELISFEPAKRNTLNRFRQKLGQVILDEIGNKPLVGVIQAISVGIQSNITSQEWKVFQATGTTHIVAISGTHVGWVAAICAGFITFCVRRNYHLTSLAPAGYFGGVGAIIGAVLYSACAGFSVPTQRACIMVLVVIGALLARQSILSWQSFALCWIGVGILSPFAPLQLGFWLSFGCVAALILGRTHYQKRNWFLRWVMPQWVVFIGLLPFSSLFFHQIPVLSPLANMIFLPLVSLVIIPFSLLGLLGVPYAYTISYKALCTIWPLLVKLQEMKQNLWYFPQASFFAIFLGILSVLLLLGPSGLPGRNLGWCGLLALLFPRLDNVPFGTFEFTLLDVGQGLSAVIRTEHHTLLYDAGPVYGKESDAGNKIILPFLRLKGVTNLDKIIISHGDLDHRGGLLSLQHFPYGEVITSEPLKLSFLSRLCQSGETWEWDGVVFALLSPIKKYKKRNNLSCVLKVSTKNKSVLLTGDIELQAEQDMAKEYASLLRSDVLVVPHHGSLTSSSVEFIDAVSPKYALFPVGKDNQYHFPKAEIKYRYQLKGIKNLLAWQRGAIIFHIGSNDELTPPIQWRDTFQHYWNKKEY